MVPFPELVLGLVALILRERFRLYAVSPGMADRYTFRSRTHNVSNKSPRVWVSRSSIPGAVPSAAGGNEGSTK